MLYNLAEYLRQPLKIGGKAINSRIVLAPMSFMGHIAFRELMSSYGGCGLLFSEMCSAKAIPNENRFISPYFRWRDEERSRLICQIFGDDSQVMADAARRIEAEGLFGVDINFGCSNKRICRRNCGAALLKNPDQATASANFTVTVNSVNDAPVANVPALNVTSDPDNNVFDLKPFASDVDNTTAELDWEFFGFNDFDFQWVNQSDKILRIVALSTPAAEQGFFRVFDSQNGADTVAVALNVANDPDLVLEISINDVSFDEDNSLTLELADAIVNSDYAFNELDWTFTEGANLGFSFDPDDRELTLFADDADWFGESFFTVTAIAPDQNSASTTFNVVIDPVNDAPVSVAETFYVSAASNPRRCKR